jgi:zinc protease
MIAPLSTPQMAVTRPLPAAPTRRRRTLRWALLLLVLPASLSGAGHDPTPAPEAATLALEAPVPLDPAIRQGRLDNGLTYLVQASPQPEGPVELWLAVRAGSVFESEAERGLAHFVEHLMFRGTRRFPHQALLEWAESIGMRFGPDLNAFTSYDETVYPLRLPPGQPEALERALTLFTDWIGGAALFDPQDVDRERAVVLEELRLHRQAEDRRVERTVGLLLAGTRYQARSPSGLQEIVASATPAQLRAFYERWYRPELAAVLAVGPFDADAVVARVRHHLATVPRSTAATARPSFELLAPIEPRVEVFADPDLTETTIELLQPLAPSPVRNVGDFRQSLLVALHDRMLSYRLLQRLQAAESPWTQVQGRHTGLVSALARYGQRVVASPGRALPAFEALVAENERLRRFGFVPIELFRAKTALLRELETAHRVPTARRVNARAERLLAHFLSGDAVPAPELELALAQRLLPGIPLEEVNRFAERLHTARNHKVMIAGPPSEAAPLPTAAEVQKVLDDAPIRQLERYVERLPSTDASLALLGRPPAGTIVEERQRPEHDITEWRLSNGAWVILKPARFGSNEVTLEAFSAGGTSLLPASESFVGQLAAALVRPAELDALPARVRVDVEINELDEGVWGKAPADQLEALLRGVRSAFTSPKTDLTALARQLEVESQRFALADKQPFAALLVAIDRATFGDDPRRAKPSAAEIAAFDPSRLLALYRERFANAADFQFVLVGDLELETARPLVESYLASLPGHEGRETFQNHGVAVLNQATTVRVQQGKLPNALVALRFAGQTPFRLLPTQELETLGELLERRLRERLRFQQGQVYTLEVGARMRARPTGHYQVDILLPVAPHEADKARDAALEEIRRLQTEGPTEPEVAALVAAARQDRERALRKQSFWLGTLVNTYRLNLDLREQLDLESRLRVLDAERLRQAARQYLPLDRYLLAVLEPEPAPGSGAP